MAIVVSRLMRALGRGDYDGIHLRLRDHFVVVVGVNLSACLLGERARARD
ncbi:MAG: hypothetical protein HYY79_07780 [Betaproteobacteria bacterium]|nr:hypothetical protein [Betaproteobacteria bacterium]